MRVFISKVSFQASADTYCVCTCMCSHAYMCSPPCVWMRAFMTLWVHLRRHMHVRAHHAFIIDIYIARPSRYE
jgi:hypothetical protein